MKVRWKIGGEVIDTDIPKEKLESFRKSKDISVIEGCIEEDFWNTVDWNIIIEDKDEIDLDEFFDNGKII